MCLICILLPGITLSSIFISASILYNNNNKNDSNNIDDKMIYWI